MASKPLLNTSPEEAVALAIREFPETFGLRRFAGKVFAISKASSYYTEESGVMLYVMVQTENGWLSFAKGTPKELRKEIVDVATV